MLNSCDVAQEIGGFDAATAELELAQPAESLRGGKAMGPTKPGLDSGIASMVQRVFLAPAGKAPHLVVVAAIRHGDGCSHTAVLMAEALATLTDGRVCLVEGNLRTPSLSSLAPASPTRGFSDALLDEDPIRAFTKPVRSGRFHLLTAGSAPEKPSLLGSLERVRARFSELRRSFDFILVDAPPLSQFPETTAMARLADGLILVLEAGATRRQVARLNVATLRDSQVPILAAILNKRTYPIPKTIYDRL